MFGPFRTLPKTPIEQFSSFPTHESPTMLICHCECVNDRRIRQEIGAGARTVGQVGRACRAGTRCGGCVGAVAELLEKADARSSYSRPLPLAAE